MKANEYREQMATQFLKVLEEKQLDWKKEWGGIRVPTNGNSNRAYRGINRFYLTMIAAERGYQDNRWCTFYQVQKNGWSLKNARGQGVRVEYWFPYDTKEQRNLTWEEYRALRDPSDVRYEIRVTFATVFNAQLIERIRPLPAPETKNIQPAELVQTLSRNMNVPILHDGLDRAFYLPEEDRIHLPVPEAFHSEYAYDSTALHELCHATGAPHRLNRNMDARTGSPEYAYEELIAEITSCFLSSELQIEQTENHIENHKAYVQYWIREIKEKPETLIRAIREAEQTTGYMEYQAGLIKQQEYEQIRHSSGEVHDTNLDEKKENSQVEMIREEHSSKSELDTIESEASYPDSNTQQQIGNMFQAYANEQENGNIIPQKTLGELQQIMTEIRRYVKLLEANTQFFKDCLEKCNLSQPENRPTQGNIEKAPSSVPADYYVVEDQVTGNTIQDPLGQELQVSSKETAKRIADLLNRDIMDAKTAIEVIQAYEQSIGRKESVIGTYEGQNLILYATSCQRYLRFGQDVERSLMGKLPNREALLVCETPKLYIEAGCSPLSMHITQRHLRNCLHEKEPGNAHYHGLTLEEIKRVPEELESPAVVAQSLTQPDSIVAILGYQEREGTPVMVSFVPGRKANYQLKMEHSNFITSVYGRDHADGFVKRLTEQNTLLYVNKKKSEKLALLPLPLRQGHLVPAYDCIIKQIDRSVNQKEKENHKLSGPLSEPSIAGTPKTKEVALRANL